MIPERGVKIPPDQLSPDTLRGVIEEFVTRDGTELTDSKIKIEQVQELLRRGEVDIWFDRITQTCSIQAAE
jgi:uncharacterized protein